MAPHPPEICTVGELRASGWLGRSVREDLRANVLARLRPGRPVCGGVFGSHVMVDRLAGRCRR